MCAEKEEKCCNKVYFEFILVLDITVSIIDNIGKTYYMLILSLY